MKCITMVINDNITDISTQADGGYTTMHIDSRDVKEINIVVLLIILLWCIIPKLSGLMIISEQ